MNNGRVVTVSSLAHETGSIDLDDLHWERRDYSRIAAYNQVHCIVNKI